MKSWRRYHAILFFWCIILTANVMYGFRIMNTTNVNFPFTIRGVYARIGILKAGELSNDFLDSSKSITISNGAPINFADLVDANGSKLELTDETILYVVVVENVPTLTAIPPVSAIPQAPLAPHPFTKTPSTPAGNGSDAGDSKKEADTQQQKAGSAATYTITTLGSTTSADEKSLDAKK